MVSLTESSLAAQTKSNDSDQSHPHPRIKWVVAVVEVATGVGQVVVVQAEVGSREAACEVGDGGIEVAEDFVVGVCQGVHKGSSSSSSRLSVCSSSGQALATELYVEVNSPISYEYRCNVMS